MNLLCVLYKKKKTFTLCIIIWYSMYKKCTIIYVITFDLFFSRYTLRAAKYEKKKKYSTVISRACFYRSTLLIPYNYQLW